MEIKELHNKLKICLHKDDLDRYNSSYDSFLSNKLEKQTIFLDLLEFIDKNIIQINEKIINFDTYLINNCDIIINIYFMDNLNYNNFFIYYSGGSIKLKRINALICSFYDFDTLCNYINCLYILNKNFFNIIYNNFSVYEYKNNYFLIIENIESFYDIFDIIFLQLLEFSNNISYSEIFITKIKEYGINILNSKNINKINFLI